MWEGGGVNPLVIQLQIKEKSSNSSLLFIGKTHTKKVFSSRTTEGGVKP